jgi:hypothetical protein
MVLREFVTMAKKKIDREESPAPLASAPAKRRAPAKKKAASQNANRLPSQAEIAEAAYFRHLNRGGTHGDEFSDWVEAERELRKRRSS